MIVLGGGPAGASAALAAIEEGRPVTIVEKSRFPRHKVCGEFLSPETASLLDRIGIEIPEATRIRRVLLRFRRSEKSFSLPETALGVSRYVFDHRLLSRAVSAGAELISESAAPPDVVACGRYARAPRGRRLFGFKAHFRVPQTDAVELYFLDSGYIGLNAVEGGFTNVCGILPEDILQQHGFDIDAVVSSYEALRARLLNGERAMEWLKTGPLVFQANLEVSTEGVYPCGDALTFVDPFTGSGILSALRTGMLAGHAAANNTTTGTYLKDCERILRQPFVISSLIRNSLQWRGADWIASMIPGRLLFSLTRPRYVPR